MFNDIYAILLVVIMFVLIIFPVWLADEKRLERRDHFRAECEQRGGVPHQPAKTAPICLSPDVIIELP